MSSEETAHRESCELSFICGKMKTIVQETVCQKSLTNCSEEVSGGGQDVCNFSEESKERRPLQLNVQWLPNPTKQFTSPAL